MPDTISSVCALCLHRLFAVSRNPGMNLAKPQVRREVRARLREECSGLEAKSESICRWIVQDPAWVRAGTVGIFAPHGGEPLVERLWEQAGGRTLCYPRIRGADLDFFAVGSPQELVSSVYGLREPEGGGDSLQPGLLDLILVPGLAFTRAGVRLGRGGGFYDRFLGREEVRAVLVGVCFEWQIWRELPEEPHDRRVGRVVTELG